MQDLHIQSGLMIGVWGYAGAAAVSLILSVLLGVSWLGSRRGGWLAMALLINAAWAVGMALDARSTWPALYIYWVEFTRAAAWCAALLSLGRGVVSPSFRRMLVVFGGLLLLLGVSLSAGWLPARISAARILGPTGMGMALSILILLEQLYRNADPQDRWWLKYLVFCMGGVYAFDFFMYAEADLLNSIAADTWQARGFVDALLLPLVLIPARHNPTWQLEVFVSRQVSFFTGVVMAVGLYSLAMVAGSYAVRLTGGQWGPALQVVFIAGAAVLLLLLVFSENLRRRARVFIAKHFYRNKYDYRIAWLQFARTLGARDETNATTTAARAVAQLFASPRCLLYVADEVAQSMTLQGSWPDQQGMESVAVQIRADSAIADYLLRTGWIIDLEEYRRGTGAYTGLVLPDWLRDAGSLRLVAPLVQADELVGIVMLQEPPAPFELTFEDIDLLKTVCQHVATHISQRVSDRRLAESRQFEAHGRLAAFLMHDLKNSAAQLQLLVTNAPRHRDNPEFFDDAIDTAANVVERISRLIRQLNGQASSGSVRTVDLNQTIEQVVRKCMDRHPTPTLKFEEQSITVVCDGEKLSSLLEHVLRNAQDATPAGGLVAIDLCIEHEQVRVTVQDSGCGMSEEFVRDRLFRPFDSTKGAKGMGIGAYQVREYVRELGGDVHVSSREGSGTRFSITLPASKVQAT